MLGDILREERERQNLSVKDVERETSIRTLYISSIEEGNYDVMPGEVYLKGFIRTYANFLKLDSAELLKLYYQEQKEKNEENILANAEAQEELLLQNELNERKSLKEIVDEKKNQSNGIIKIVAGILVGICISGVGYFAFSNSDDDATETATIAVETEKKEEATAPAKSEPAPKPVVNVNKYVEIQAKFTEKCWTHVEADGKVLFEGIPQKDESLNWKADKELVITVGNAGAVELVSNGKNVGKLGKNGEVITKKFLSEGDALPK